jgi:hypothetical protein
MTMHDGAGGHQNSGVYGDGTALGLLLQNLEIKRKKPTWVCPCEMQLPQQSRATKVIEPPGGGAKSLGSLGLRTGMGLIRRFFLARRRFWP